MNRKSTGLVLVAVAALLGAAAWPLSCSPSSPGSGGSSSAGPGSAGPGAGGGVGCSPVTLTTEGASGIAVDATSVYFTTLDGKVRKMPLAGGPAVTIATSGAPASGIVVNAGYACWDADGSVAQVPLAGGPVTTLATAAYPRALAVDATSVYWVTWSEPWDPEIDAGKETNPPPIVLKVPIGGGAVTVLAAGAGFATGGLAVDDAGVYWVEAGQFENRLMRVPKGGGPAVELAAEPPSSSTRDALVVDAASVHWVSSADGAVRRVPKSGGAATLLTGAFPSNYYGLSVAADATSLYWSSNGAILKVGLDGGPVSATPPMNNLGDLAVGAAGLYWADLLNGGVLTVSKDCASSPDQGDAVDAGAFDGGCTPSARYEVIDPGYDPGDDRYDMGLLRDTTTNLIWTRYAAGFTSDPCGYYGASQGYAAMYCAGIGMRLPTETEALGVAADADPCAWPVPWHMWTSTPDGPGKAWVVSAAGEAAHDVGDVDTSLGAICVWGTCSPPGSCACDGAGAACTKDSECCSHACKGGTCACAAVGYGCEASTDCCFGTCDTSTGACACAAPGGACGATSDCCFGTCQGGACVCSPLGAICSAGAGSTCCTGVCDTGACSCRGASITCTSDANCCSGTCAGGACTCSPAGSPCTDPTDCCSGSCPAGTCLCAPAGTPCTSGALCCSGSCTGGACAP